MLIINAELASKLNLEKGRQTYIVPYTIYDL